MLLPVQLILLQTIHKIIAVGLAGSSAQQAAITHKLYATVTRKKQNFGATE